MTAVVLKDINEIYSRLFDHKPFLNGEVKFFFREFEEERQDREVENLFNALQRTSEIRDSSIERSLVASVGHLPEIHTYLTKSISLCNDILGNQSYPQYTKIAEENRQNRKIIWQHFVDDMSHKCSRVDITFEEKEEELREFYTDLEQKLHIHK